LARLSSVVVLMVFRKGEHGLVGQRNFATRILGFFYGCEHVDLQIVCTADGQKLHIQKQGKTHSNKGCIPAVLSRFDKVTANHKITSSKTTDSAVLGNRLIQFNN
jgi:hypothetical protein